MSFRRQDEHAGVTRKGRSNRLWGMSTFVVHNRRHTPLALPGEIGPPIGRRSLAAHLGFGLAIGSGLGVAARGFMRLLAADPEFSWSGTILIVGLFAVFGVVQGAVAATRSRTTRQWITLPVRLVGGFSYLMLVVRPIIKA